MNGTAATRTESLPTSVLNAQPSHRRTLVPTPSNRHRYASVSHTAVSMCRRVCSPSHQATVWPSAQSRARSNVEIMVDEHLLTLRRAEPLERLDRELEQPSLEESTFSLPHCG